MCNDDCSNFNCVITMGYAWQSIQNKSKLNKVQKDSIFTHAEMVAYAILIISGFLAFIQQLQPGALIKDLWSVPIDAKDLDRFCVWVHLCCCPVQSASHCRITVYMEMCFTEYNGGRKKNTHPLESNIKTLQRMIILRQRSPPALNYSLFLSILYSALKCMVMSSNQGQIVLFCSVRSWGRKWALYTYILHFKPIVRKIKVPHLDTEEMHIILCLLSSS